MGHFIRHTVTQTTLLSELYSISIIKVRGFRFENLK